MGFSRQEYWSRLPCPSPGDLPNPEIEPRYPTLQADSLLAEPPGKPKNTGVGILSLLQWIFPTQESNQGLLTCRWILYQFGFPEINNFPFFISTVNSRPSPVSACCISSLISWGALSITTRLELFFFYPMFCLGVDIISDSFLGKNMGEIFIFLRCCISENIFILHLHLIGILARYRFLG